MAKVAIVTGGSSGIGKAVAIKLNKSGCKVYEFSRNGSSENGIIHCSVDVTDEELVNKTVCEIFEKEKRIDKILSEREKKEKNQEQENNLKRFDDISNIEIIEDNNKEEEFMIKSNGDKLLREKFTFEN